MSPKPLKISSFLALNKLGARNNSLYWKKKKKERKKEIKSPHLKGLILKVWVWYLFTTLTTWNKTDISQIFVQFVQFSPDEKTISITIKNILITSWFLCFCNISHLISLIMNSFLLMILCFQQHLPIASPQIILTTTWIFVLGHFSSSPAHLDFCS